ncbi:hypothetical protein [Paraburkholderia strydomiana]|uniref:hypothetical protein n=1 Tax=Paraburkholderia strydomiana TaxID=1245417 RepID=UPI0038BD39DE
MLVDIHLANTSALLRLCASLAGSGRTQHNTQRGCVGRALNPHACDADANLDHSRDDGLGLALRLNGQCSHVLNRASLGRHFYRQQYRRLILSGLIALMAMATVYGRSISMGFATVVVLLSACFVAHQTGKRLSASPN